MEYLLAAFFYCAGLCATQMLLSDFTHRNKLVYGALLLLWPVPILGSVILATLEKDQ
jgi:hypothetical protein